MEEKRKVTEDSPGLEESQENNIASIGNKYTKEQIKLFNQEKKQLVYKRRRLTLVFIFAFACFLIVGANLFTTYKKIGKLQEEKTKSIAEQDGLANQIISLDYEVKLLKDEEYLQKLARSKYFFTREGELVFNVPRTDPNSRAETKASEEKTKELTESSK